MKCPPENPCTCIGKASPVAKTPCPKPDNCLELCDIVVIEGVGPCGQTGQIDVADAELYGHNYGPCEGLPSWSLYDYEGSFVSVSITPQGLLTWVTGNPESVGSFTQITLYASCGDYGAYMEVIIGTKDMCKGIVCDECMQCDPCRGLCIEKEADVVIGGFNSKEKVIIDGKDNY